MDISVANWLTKDKRYIEAAGLSTEEKPTEKVAAGSIYVEVDTGDVYLFNGAGEWVKQFCFQPEE